MTFRAWLTTIVIFGIFSSVVGCSPATPVEVAPATETVSTFVPVPEPAALVNPGFEEKDANGLPTGWSSTGSESAILLEESGHASNFRLTQKSSETYQVETSQTVSGLANGWYTLRAWVRSSGKQVEVYLALKCGDEEKRV